MSKRTVAVIVAGFCCIFVSFAVRYAYGLLLPHMLPDLDITKAQAGTIYSAYFIAYMVFSPILGLLVDRFDARMILTVFIGLLGLGTLLMAFATNLLFASLFFGLAGLGQSAGWVPVITLVQRWVSERRRGTAIAVVDLGSGMGIIVVSLTIPVITAALSWRGAWTYLGILGLVVAGLSFFMISNPPSQNAEAPSSPSPSVDLTLVQVYRMVMGTPAFWLIGISYSLVSFCILIPFAFLTAYATLGLFISYRVAAYLIGAVALAGICGKLTLAHISDRIRRVYVMILCGVLTCAGTLGMAFSQSFGGLMCCAVIFGVGYGAIWPVYGAAARDYFKKEYAGRIIGLWTLFLGVGSIVSPVLAGWTVDVSGGYMWAFILAAGAAALSAGTLIPVLGMKSMQFENYLKEH